MSALITGGTNSIIVSVPTPYESDGTTIRDDLSGIKVWYATSSGFTPPAAGTLAYNGSGLTVTIPGLDPTVTYFVRYSLISDIDPDVLDLSSEYTVIPLSSSAQIVDISGFTGFAQNAGGTITPATATLSAVTTNINSPVYAWTITGATPTTATTASVTITPNSNATTVTAKLSVTGTNTVAALVKTISMPMVYNGAVGQAGANGSMSAFPSIYIWTTTSTPPTRPTTTSTYTWSTGSYTAPTGWSTIAPTNTTPGSYLWELTFPLASVSATTITSTLDWTSVTNSIRSIAYNGTNGTVGPAGANGTNGTNGANGSSGSATFVVIRTANDSSAPTNAETVAVIGRNPVAGDIATVNYNAGNNSTIYKYTTAWALTTSYLTGDLIVAGTITGTKLAANTVTASNIDSRGLSIKAADGTVILSAGSSRATTSLDIPPTVTNTPLGWQNSNITLTSSGTLNNAGGGTVTIGGLGYTGSLSATNTYVDNAGLIQGVSSGAGTAVKNTLISVSAGGTLTGAGGGTVTIGGLGYSGDLNATNGAPSGTYVAGVLAQTVNANITAAQSTANTANSTATTAQSTANTAVTNAATAQTTANNAATAAAAAATAAADRLSKSTASVLSSTVSINATAGAGFVAGNLTWDASGTRTGGSGIALTPGGLVGYNSSGVNTFSINATTGAAIFKGDITGSTGSFAGSLNAATGTFAGQLSAATGTFAGQLSAATGTFSGALSAASGTFSGALTAGAINAVNTINIAGQAVTIPAGTTSYASTQIKTGYYSETYTTVLTHTITSTGNPTLVTVSSSFIPVSIVAGQDQTISALGLTVYLQRNGSTIFQTFRSGAGAGLDSNGNLSADLCTFSVMDYPAAGTNTYTLVFSSYYASGVGYNKISTIATLETKR